MRDLILAVVVCGGAAVAASQLWTAAEGCADRVLAGFDGDVVRRLLVPPAAWLGASLALSWLDVPRPGLVALLAGLSAVVAATWAGRMTFLVVTACRLAPAHALPLIVAGSAGWWTWALAPGRLWPLELGLAVGVLGGLVLLERLLAGRLDVAVKRREIISTGLRPLVVDDPAWTLDYVYVSPDRRYISVGYENAGADNSLSVDLLPGPTGEEGSPVELAGPVGVVGRQEVRSGRRFGRRRRREPLRYLATVEDQLVRLEFDHGESQGAEAARLTARLRPVDPGELAQRDAGLA